ncbi:MAG: rod shape-determining protein [Opitutae bacterium]|nr:rod shape-determining protein [Opitutae bacterium]
MKTTTAKATTGDVLLDADRPVLNETLLVGLDLGTNTSCLMATPVGNNGSGEAVTRELIPTVVGYANDNVLNGVLPGDAKVLFGRLALKHAKNLRVVRPMKGGVIHDQRAARLFAGHLFEVLNQANRNEIRAVIGMPASADLLARENARTAFRGIFNKVLFVPEPFLAALGYRNDARIADANYHDPVLNSLYVDIGAGSTDVCLVQGHFPTAHDQLSVPFAGDAVDQIIFDSILSEYPDCGLTLARVRELKEKNSWVLTADGATPALAHVLVGGKSRQLDVTKHVGAGCQALLQKVFEMTRELITRAESDTVAELLQNVIVTGGGSLTKGFGVALQTRLLEEGFENPRVQVLGENYKDFVALGALKTARRARENQWQTLLG